MIVRSSGMFSNSATASHFALPGVAVFFISSAGAARVAIERQRVGRFHVRGVIRGRAIRDRVLARIGDHVEFVRTAAADRAVIGRDRAELQADAREDAHVGVEHLA